MIGDLNNLEQPGRIHPRDVYMMWRTDKQPGEVPNALSQGAKAELVVNANVAVRGLIKVFGGEFKLPFTPAVMILPGDMGQISHCRVQAIWRYENGQPIIVEMQNAAYFKAVSHGWRPTRERVTTNPEVRILIKPDDMSQFAFSSLTGSNSRGLLKHELAELAKFSNLPPDVVEMKLRQINIHWGIPPKK